MDKLQTIKDTLQLTSKEIKHLDIDYVFSLINQLKDIKRIDNLIHRNVLPNDKSLLDLLIQGLLIEDEYITILKTIGDKEESKRLESKGKHLRSLEDALLD
jgi:DNA replication initiation complex subunit (GINS family)